ncbi:hypothetical protein BpHYR1_030545 [Brachionus plicatilis]|uniref:Uncharacterized protein n=1 Tax=Brachionus plicatilis TaxID=10195 RepID=A0A3M7SAX6_BRAPC|nr:hypothetical protein BpHYR1_030545 [Brachionus plicatilis]
MFPIYLFLNSNPASVINGGPVSGREKITLHKGFQCLHKYEPYESKNLAIHFYESAIYLFIIFCFIQLFFLIENCLN